MSRLSDGSLFLHSSLKLDDALLKQMLISHDPDDSRIGSEQLLQLVESIFRYGTPPESSVSEVSSLSDIELIRPQEPLGEIICRCSQQIVCVSHDENNISTHTMTLFDILGRYRWDAKVVIVLAAFAMSLGKYRLIMQLCHHSQLAASIATLKRGQGTSQKMENRFKAIEKLMSIMTELTKSLIRFCALPTQHFLLDDDPIMASTKIQAYTAAYWVIRNTLIWSSRIINLGSAGNAPAGPSAAAIWELTSVASRLGTLCYPLKQQVDICHQQTERKLCHRLVNHIGEVYTDNQMVLQVLLAMHDDFPLKDCASPANKPKSVSELKNKVVLLLVSKPELLPIEMLLMLSEKLSHYKENGSYDLVWIPIPASSTWSETDRRSFQFFSNSMPWHSVRKPWLLSQAVIDYTKQTWEYKGEPILIVLDTQGAVTNANALDMALVWGGEAYPFSSSREHGLWDKAKWTPEFLLDDIDPLVSTWMEEGRDICIYGGTDKKWIGEFISKVKNMVNAGLQVKLVYLGAKNSSLIATDSLTPSDKKYVLNVSLSTTRLEFFWLRVDSMQRSRLRMLASNTENGDQILHQIENLLGLRWSKDGWAIFGTPKDEMKYVQGDKVMECLTKFSFWGKNVASLGSLGAIRPATEPPPPETPASPKTEACNHFKAVAYKEEMLGRAVVCDHCKRPMEIFFISDDQM